MDLEKIGKFIASLREKKGLSQEELSEVFGVSRTTISRWECGTRAPDISLLIPISEYFDISVGELLNGKKNTTVNEENKATKELVNYSINIEKKKYNKLIVVTIIVCLIIFSISFYILGLNSGKYTYYEINNEEYNLSLDGYILTNSYNSIINITDIIYLNKYNINTDNVVISILYNNEEITSLSFKYDDAKPLDEILSDEVYIYTKVEKVINASKTILQVKYTTESGMINYITVDL